MSGPKKLFIHSLRIKDQINVLKIGLIEKIIHSQFKGQTNDRMIESAWNWIEKKTMVQPVISHPIFQTFGEKYLPSPVDDKRSFAFGPQGIQVGQRAIVF